MAAYGQKQSFPPNMQLGKSGFFPQMEVRALRLTIVIKRGYASLGNHAEILIYCYFFRGV
jgi:hypothetical protein